MSVKYRLASRPSGEVCDYAAAELFRCLSLMDATLTEGEGGLCLTLKLIDGDPELDTVKIAVEGGIGTIGATNEGALLIAVYRFLYELGCHWTHPGEGGEHIPARSLNPDGVSVHVSETPSRRHRGVCIEGACSEENVIEMIEFLPRVGMNSYFIQFFRPTVFFARWYEHWHNDTLAKEELTPERIDAIHDRVVVELRRRGLRHHAVGHGWTCVPFGVPGEGWHQLKNEDLPPEYLAITAELDGVRLPWHNTPINTNLCYSRADVRERIAKSVADYCESHVSVSVLHLWLADGSNNNCECPACRDTRPSDYYVMLLNEVDAELTARGLDTKVVFLAYVDLLWAPEREVIKNPDRFLMMFAPITRTYSKTYREGIAALDTVEKRPFVRNKLIFPRGVGENVAYLNDWRKTFPGSGFVFDYHLMWDHGRDAGYMDVSRTLFADMKDLDLLGLDGMISCQLSRSTFPTGLPIYGMARALWDKNADFDTMADEYFAAEFGELAADVRAYLEEVTRLTDPIYVRGEKPAVSEEARKNYEALPALVEGFLAKHPEVTETSENEALRTLAIHAEVVTRLSALGVGRAIGEKRTAVAEEIRAYLRARELTVQHRLDLWNYSANALNAYFLEEKV